MKFVPCCFVLITLFFVTFPARAETLLPTSAWLVGPATLGEGTGKPCLAMNQFSNGYSLRLSGGSNTIMAMALEVRHALFTPRQKYDVRVMIPKRFDDVIRASAHDAATLLFGLQGHDDFYKQLSGAETLELSIDGAPLSLSLAGLDDGLRRMNACAGTVTAKAAPSPAQPQPRTALASQQNPLIEPSTVAALEDKAQDVEAMMNTLMQDATSKAEPKQAAKPTEHVEILNPAQTWSDPKITRTNPAGIMTGIVDVNGADKQNAKAWRALKGANLRDTLAQWTASAGMRLDWKTGDDFSILQSISFEGQFEQAVETLLLQYKTQTTRPIGQIYKGVAGQTPVLSITSARVQP